MSKKLEKNYSEWYELLCKELCCEMEKFENSNEPTYENLKCIKDLIESICGLQEIEVGGVMRDYAEEQWGYDMDEGMPDYYEPYMDGIYNATRRGGMRRRGGGTRRRDSRGRYVSNYFAPDPYGYPSYGPNRGGMNPNTGNVPGRGRATRDDGRMDYDDDEPYMLRQDGGRPIMTPYAMHTGNIPKKLTDEQYKEWMRDLINSDGTDGAKWTKQQIEAEAKKIGVDYNEIGIDALWACVNMMYSDYCEVAQKYGVNNPGFYIHMADSFLNDDDFDGTGKEKLSIYYHTIVENDK